MKKWLYTWIFCRMMGWKIVGHFNPGIRKCVFAIVPHTSWFDFVVGLFVRGIIGAEIGYVAKRELFRFPFGWYFRWMGGTPLDRSGGRRKVDTIAAIFDSKAEFRLAIAPEGTRKRVNSLKTGFYYIALKAQVPIILVAFDYPTRTVKISRPVMVSGDIDADMPVMEAFFKGITGKIAEYSFTPREY